MKNLILILFCALSLMFFSCSDSNGNNQNENENGNNNENSNIVTEKNLNDFFDVYIPELIGYASPQQCVTISESQDGNILSRRCDGHKGGYIETIRKINPNNQIVSETKYFNWSNTGFLRLNGNFISQYDWQLVGGVGRTQYSENGQIHFSGEFNGTIEFQDYRWAFDQSRPEGQRAVFLSGRVIIGSLNITEQHFQRTLSHL